jgi:hypothetical protein
MVWGDKRAPFGAVVLNLEFVGAQESYFIFTRKTDSHRMLV